MWVLVSGDLEKTRGVIFNYSSSKAEKVAKNLLNNYKRILIKDIYNFLLEKIL